jgi:hypothetical protein
MLTTNPSHYVPVSDDEDFFAAAGDTFFVASLLLPLSTDAVDDCNELKRTFQNKDLMQLLTIPLSNELTLARRGGAPTAAAAACC